MSRRGAVSRQLGREANRRAQRVEQRARERFDQAVAQAVNAAGQLRLRLGGDEREPEPRQEARCERD